jgi:hypothetical protein
LWTTVADGARPHQRDNLAQKKFSASVFLRKSKIA